MADKIDSNITGLAIAEEASLKTLGASPVWHELEPNSYSDFGAEISTVSRATINASRQRKKGVVVDLDASGGFESDLTPELARRLFQGFMFADAHQKASTQPLNGTAVTLTTVDGTGNDFEATSGLGIFASGDIVLASGFAENGNNGIKHVTGATGTAVTVTETLTTETPAATAMLEKVGVKAGTADLNVVVGTGIVTIASTLLDFTDLGLIPGEFIFIGGDSAGTKFVNNVGYARVKSISANALVLDDTSWTPANETGTGLAIEIFFGTAIRNEKTTALIKRKSYQLERQLGSDDDGVQSEYIVGSIPNEMSLTLNQADKITYSMSFVGMDQEFRDGATGIKAGARIAAPVDDIFNTSSNLVRTKLYIVDGTTTAPTALFGYASELSLSIANGVTPDKALGVLGAFDASIGDFAVSGSLNAYFSEVAAVAAVRNNSDVGLSVIGASENKGFVFDIPLLSLGDGRLNVEKDSPVRIPLETNAFENDKGYTLMTVFFPYLPTIAMP